MAGKVLIADAVATNRIILRAKLASAHYEPILAGSGHEALTLAQVQRPDLVLLSCDLADIPANDVCQRLKADSATRDIPVIMIASQDDPAQRLAAFRVGADEVYCKPLDETLLQARMRNLMRASQMQAQHGLREGTARALGFAEPADLYLGPGLIGIVSARIEEALHLKRELQPLMGDRLLVMDRDAALGELPGDTGADVYVICGEMGRPGEALRFMSELRSRPATRHCAVCLILPQASRASFATALDLGASDLIDCTAPATEKSMRIRSQLQGKRRADGMRTTVADGLRLAVIDPLTGLHNRRYGLSHLNRVAQRAGEKARPFAVLLLDLDRFKSVNDTWGHAVGDLVLAEVAQRLKANLRLSDLLARIGGEEFLIVLPDTGFHAAHATAERLRQAVSERPIPIEGGGALRITLSIGLAMGGEAQLPCEDIIAQADRALLASKAEGRNQVTVHRSAA